METRRLSTPSSVAKGSGSASSDSSFISLFSQTTLRDEEGAQTSSSIWAGNPQPNDGGNRSYALLSVGSHECSRSCVDLHWKFMAKCAALVVASRLDWSDEETEWAVDDCFSVAMPLPLVLGERADAFTTKQLVFTHSGTVLERWSIECVGQPTSVDLMDVVHRQAVLLVRALMVNLALMGAALPAGSQFVLQEGECTDDGELKSRLALPPLVTPHITMQLVRRYKSALHRRPSASTASSMRSSSILRTTPLDAISEDTPIDTTVRGAYAVDVAALGAFVQQCEQALNELDARLPGDCATTGAELIERTRRLLEQIDVEMNSEQVGLYPLTSSFHIDDDEASGKGPASATSSASSKGKSPLLMFPTEE